eukprot:TRINITY_DN3168_c0_g1_i1.p1 TRINITY_DN3168_c0_g1~~TRINITY_DN3168_c0_g1_i1.p1  ORF type:complete len:306 (+),score=56.21 TRINITY_DN3168_c0_g1_i1:290-1207(+)
MSNLNSQGMDHTIVPIPPPTAYKKYASGSNSNKQNGSKGNNGDNIDNKREIKSVLRALVMEYICTTLFIFFATGGAVEAQLFGPKSYSANLVVALAQGFALAAFISAAASTSGGHLNPAVTFAAFISGLFKWWKAILYILVQIVAGITASALLIATLPGQHHDSLGATTIGEDISQGRALLFEAIMTFALVLVVLSTAVSPSNKALGKFAPLPIGLTLSTALLISWPYTGTSLNPARSFGPALISGTWKHHWIFWVGPIIGALLAGLIYGYVIIPSNQRKDSGAGENNNSGNEDDNNNENNNDNN